MGMSRCYSLMKCFHILFNIIFLCVGSGACGFAGWALWEGGGGVAGGSSSAARAGLCAVLVWGVALVVAALLALAGCARASSALLAAAAALLTLTAAAEAAVAWWGAAHLPHLRQALRDRLQETIRRDYGVIHSHTQIIDAIQQGLECCGGESARDWQGSTWARGAAAGAAPGAAAALDLSVSAPTVYYWVPPSCCATEDATECSVARRVPAASGAGGAGGGGGAGHLHAAACGARVAAAVERGARAPLVAGAALLATHALALLLALALAVRVRPPPAYKA